MGPAFAARSSPVRRSRRLAPLPRVTFAVTPVHLTVAAAVVGGVLTAVVTLVPLIPLAFRSLPGHLVLETVDACVASLVALLLYGRFRRSRALQELLLVDAMVLLAVAGISFATLPAVAGETRPAVLTTWAPLVVRVLGGAVFAAAALSAGRTVTHRRGTGRHMALVLLTLAAVWLVGFWLNGRLPEAVDPALTPERSWVPDLHGHVGVLVAQAANALFYAFAAVLFTRQAKRTGDELMSWVGPAATLSAFARVNYALFPSLYTQWLYTGDVLRTMFYIVLLLGAAREIGTYWAAQTEAAAFAERRRLARDLHDGAVQELGFIRSQAHLLGSLDEGSTAARQIEHAAERAIDEARRAIAALTAPTNEPWSATITRAAAEVGDRYEVRVVTNLNDGLTVTADQREALVRIVREAVSNAARHGQPGQVAVLLNEHTLVVEDDGHGFDPTAPLGPDCFGLTSMADRAAGIGARFRIDSAPGRGTRVVVEIP